MSSCTGPDRLRHLAQGHAPFSRLPNPAAGISHAKLLASTHGLQRTAGVDDLMSYTPPQLLSQCKFARGLHSTRSGGILPCVRNRLQGAEVSLGVS